MNQLAVAIKPLAAPRVLDQDELVPLPFGDGAERNEGKRHARIAIQATHEETMLVCSKKKVHPVCGARKYACSARRGLRNAAAKEDLLAPALQVKPAADRACGHAIQPTGEWNLGKLDGRSELQRAIRIRACTAREVQIPRRMAGIQKKHGIV